MNKQTLPLFLFSLLVTMAGCGGGSQGTGAYDSGLPKNKDIRTLSDEERAKVCAVFKEANRRALAPEPLCTYASLSAEIDDPDRSVTLPGWVCLGVKEECLKSFDQIAPPEEVEKEINYCPVEIGEPFDCQEDVDVALLDQCINDALDLQLTPYLGLSCSDASRFASTAELDRYAFPDRGPNWVPDSPSCMEIESRCPGFFKDE